MNFVAEYEAGLYGGQSVAQGLFATPHFELSSTGVATTKNLASAVLYSPGQCLCAGGTPCFDYNDPSSPYYRIVHNGLDGLIKGYLDAFETIVTSNQSLATPSLAAYQYVIALGQQDIEGGLVLLCQTYYSELQSNYSQTLSLQIVQMVRIAGCLF